MEHNLNLNDMFALTVSGGGSRLCSSPRGGGGPRGEVVVEVVSDVEDDDFVAQPRLGLVNLTHFRMTSPTPLFPPRLKRVSSNDAIGLPQKRFTLLKCRLCQAFVFAS